MNFEDCAASKIEGAGKRSTLGSLKRVAVD